MRLFSLLIPFLPWLTPFPPKRPPSELTFTRERAHTTVLLDNDNDTSFPLTLFSTPSNPSLSSRISLRTVPTRVYRPRSLSAFHAARRRSMFNGQSEKVPWDVDIVPGPDITDRETLLELAKMTSNAYGTPDEDDWYDLGGRWNNSTPFGWEDDADGFRGHVFVSSDNPPTVVLSIKGTSVYVPGTGGGGPTAKKDKLNDNLLFSCCCARVNWQWTPVCDCYSEGWKCDQGCLSEALKEESLFYPLGTNLYNNLTYLYPDANIWVIGHSLGGALSSLLGLTFGAPVVSFEAPGDRLAATRLHLPLPPSDAHITHVYHTADPIAMGVCTGTLSSCAALGFALETRCHLGRSVVYDTVGQKKWSVDVRTHRIAAIIERVLGVEWEEGDRVPMAEDEEGCVDCYKWEFGDFKCGDSCPSVS